MFLLYVRNYKITGKYPTEGRNNIDKLTAQHIQNCKIEFSSGTLATQTRNWMSMPGDLSPLLLSFPKHLLQTQDVRRDEHLT